MSADWLFVTFGIPAIAIAMAYAAMLANRRALRRARERGE